jgi:hypothetical protein
MSLSEPRLKNPASKFICWSGSKGKFYYYDKELGEKGENVYFEKEIYVIPLDELSTIKGFHDRSQSGIYSNEVKNTTKEPFIVKAFKGGLIADGLYQDIKGKLEGGDYAKSVYCALINIKADKTTELELVNLSLHGSSIGPWIDAKIQVDSGNVIILKPSTNSLKKGQTVYFAPEIIKSKVRQDILEKCKMMDRDLQIYLKGYLNRPIEQTEQITESQELDKPLYEPYEKDDLPF